MVVRKTLLSKRSDLLAKHYSRYSHHRSEDDLKMIQFVARSWEVASRSRTRFLKSQSRGQRHDAID